MVKTQEIYCKCGHSIKDHAEWRNIDTKDIRLGECNVYRHMKERKKIKGEYNWIDTHYKCACREFDELIKEE